MVGEVKINSKNELVQFIILKRKMRDFVRKGIMVFAFIVACGLLITAITFREEIRDFYSKTQKFVVETSQSIFSTQVNKISIQFDEPSLLNKKDIQHIVDSLAQRRFHKKQLLQIVSDIKENNKLIKNIYIRKNISTGEMKVHINEHKILGVVYPDGCDDYDCKVWLMTTKGDIIVDHNIRQINGLLKIYGTIGTNDILYIKSVFQKHKLYQKVASINFFTSGRFDIVLYNGLKVIFPRSNWEREIERFAKLDSEYNLSVGKQSHTYIDLRVPDKIFVD